MFSISFVLFVTIHMPCSFSEPMTLPKGLAVFLKKMGIPREEFMRSYQAYNAGASIISARQHDESTRSHISSDVPVHSGGVITTKLHNTVYIPNDAHCEPRPALIELPRVFGTTLFPSFVVLHRCGGSCSSQDAQHCAVMAQDAINVQILKIIHKQVSFLGMTFYNHTHCGCDCILTASDCDPLIQTWNKDHCKCVCIGNELQCDSATQSWDNDACTCFCNTAPQFCDHPDKEWDTENCGCHCKKTLQKQCTENNQPINTATCKCIDLNAL